MYLLLSGEGPTDMGFCNPSSTSCEGDDFMEGPMAIMVDQLVRQFQGYEMSYLDCQRIYYVSERFLADNKQSPRRKEMSLRGKRKPPETKYYYENARALATQAKSIESQIDDNVIAVLFRDADGTASAGRGNWENKRNSMLEGFRVESYELGVAMIPKPKSEAWLLCATKQNQYQHCDKIENESGNDNARNSLKKQLSESLQGKVSREDINQLLRDGIIDVAKIDMNSFNAFKENLEAAIELAIDKAQ